jgi:hypothetical protein
MHKTTLILLLISTSVTFADNVTREEYDPKPMVEGNRRVDEIMEWHKNHPGEMPPLTEQEKEHFFTKQGVPLPGSGATIANNTQELGATKEQRSVIARFNSAQKSQGYYETNNKRAQFLFSMPEMAEKEYNERKSVAFNAHDTHLYESKNNLAMGYAYKGVPANLSKKVIGFAPESNFVNGKWNGAVEFFTPFFDSACAYHEVNIQLTQSSASIPKEIVTYAVNNKLTKMNVIGSSESGFVYEVEWWDKTYKRNLECAAKVYTEAMRAQVIELAKKIDKA